MPYNADSLKKTYEAYYKKQRIANLIELREEIANLSLTDFSKQIGIQKSNLSSLEKGDRDLSLFNIQAYKTFFREKYNLDISADYLLGYSKNKYANENYQMISRVTGLSDKSIDCLKYLQTVPRMTQGILVLNTLMKEKEKCSAILGNIGILLDLWEWVPVTATMSEDEKENTFCHNLPPNTFLGFAQKDNNNNFNGCLTLDNSILKDTSLLKIKSIIETYKLRSDD